MDRDLSEIPIQFIKGVGPQRAKLLSRLKIETAGDSLYYLPYRYENRKSIKKIHDLINGERETTVGSIISAEVIHRPRSRFKIFELAISDGTGILKGKWFNQPYMKKLFRVGQEVILSGIVKENTYRGTGFEMDKPEYEFTGGDAENLIHTSRIVPVYQTTTGLSVRVLRSIIFAVLHTLPELIIDPIPEETLARNGLPGLQESLVGAHFPPPEADIESLNRGVSAYQRRLSFNELFYLEIGIAIVVSRVYIVGIPS